VAVIVSLKVKNNMSTTPHDKERRTSIYVLKDPISNNVRYVGKTVATLKRRLDQHIYDAKSLKIQNHRTN
jgi:hypothetical protein